MIIYSDNVIKTIIVDILEYRHDHSQCNDYRQMVWPYISERGEDFGYHNRACRD